MKLKWGILGTGNIAKAFARGVQASSTGELTAVGSRTQASADTFGDHFKIPHRHSSYEDLLADSQVMAVYIATPHPMHAELAIKAADAGKHVLCEKPIGVNHAEAMTVIEAAQRNNVFLMEAFMYRCHPQTRKLVELIREKAIGDVKMIQAAFSFYAAFRPESRLYANALAGGGILDVGCYPISFSRLIAGVALGKNFAEPQDVRAFGHLGKTGIDEYSAAILKFPGDILAQVTAGVGLTQENTARIYGTHGNIFVKEPWTPAREGGVVKLVIQRTGEPPEEIAIEAKNSIYTIEADTVAGFLENKQAKSPAMSWDDSLGNMKTLDLWREQIGLVYDLEKCSNQTMTVSRRPLTKRADSPMKYGRIPGVEKPVSRLVLGVDNQRTIAHGSAMFDDFFERGGNCFDTAWIYKVEHILGQWQSNRKIREQIVILDKGAHTPECHPEGLTRQFKESLERLQTDYVDIYMLHRDNPQVPAGEFIDALNEHRNAGRMRAFGASNWSIERVEAANDYAQKKGLTGFAAVSNNFSLARMVEPVWGGCIAASDAKSREWFTKTQMVLMPWSSQARGFFTDRANPSDLSDAEMVRGWYAEDNWQRRERAYELAAERGVEPIVIALAYVLCQPFPTFPLIGPRLISETRSSMPALNIQLTPDEVKWLNLEK